MRRPGYLGNLRGTWFGNAQKEIECTEKRKLCKKEFKSKVGIKYCLQEVDEYYKKCLSQSQ